MTFLLQLTGEYGLLRDEAYCQVLKQITENTSSKTYHLTVPYFIIYHECNVSGNVDIRLLLLCCSETVVREAGGSCTSLQHTTDVQKYWSPTYWNTFKMPVQVQGYNTKVQYCYSRILTRMHRSLKNCINCIKVLDFFPGIAKACEQNLRKTFQYGGRNKHPNTMELKAMMVSYFIHLIINQQWWCSYPYLDLFIFLTTLGQQELQTAAISSPRWNWASSKN